MERYVPDEVTDRVKQGSPAPTRAGSAARASTTCADAGRRRRRAIYEFLDPTTVRSLVDEHLAGGENRRLLLWSLLNFEHWCEAFLQRSPVTDIAELPTVASV